MAKDSKIEWCDHTLNLWHGCTKVHAGCKNCYAETLDKRYHKAAPHWGVGSSRKLIKSAFANLAKWQAQAASENRIDTVFCGSMMDIFEESKPLVDHKGNPIFIEKQSLDINNGLMCSKETGDLRNTLFQNIQDNCYPNIRFLFLTKRPENIEEMCPPKVRMNPLCWFGTSVSDQKTADKLAPQLVSTNVRNRFLSIEPMVGAINMLNIAPTSDVSINDIDWIIVGGESGHGKRPFNPDWARLIQSDCILNHVVFFMKQWDKVQPIPPDLMVREFPWV